MFNRIVICFFCLWSYCFADITLYELSGGVANCSKIESVLVVNGRILVAWGSHDGEYCHIKVSVWDNNTLTTYDLSGNILKGSEINFDMNDTGFSAVGWIEDGEYDSVHVSIWNGSSWIDTILAANINHCQNLSVSLNSLGKVAAVWSEMDVDNNYYFKGAYYDGTAWGVYTIDTVSAALIYNPVLVFDDSVALAFWKMVNHADHLTYEKAASFTE